MALIEETVPFIRAKKLGFLKYCPSYSEGKKLAEAEKKLTETVKKIKKEKISFRNLVKECGSDATFLFRKIHNVDLGVQGRKPYLLKSKKSRSPKIQTLWQNGVSR